MCDPIKNGPYTYYERYWDDVKLKMQIVNINVQNVMNESDARAEDDLGKREAEVVWF